MSQHNRKMQKQHINDSMCGLAYNRKHVALDDHRQNIYNTIIYITLLRLLGHIVWGAFDFREIFLMSPDSIIAPY